MTTVTSFPDWDQPELQDTSGGTSGGFIWIVLFGCVMAASTLANLVLTFMVMGNRRKHNFVYMDHLLLFVVNIIEYSSLLFEFSLGVDHQFYYSERACVAYQSLARTTPIIQSWTMVILIYHTAHKFCQTSSDSSRSDAVVCNRNNELVYFSGILTVLVALAGILAIPAFLFSKIIQENGKQYCGIDLSSESGASQQESISVFYLLYSSIMPYWLPLFVSLKPLMTLIRSRNNGKYPEVDITLSTALSFFLFFLGHGVLVFFRHTFDVFGVSITHYYFKVIEVGQSLLWLVAYFWHFARPALVISLDPDLRRSIDYCSRCGWHHLSNSDEDTTPENVEVSRLCPDKDCTSSDPKLEIKLIESAPPTESLAHVV